MCFRCTFSHVWRCIHFPELLKKATFSHLNGICSQKRMLGHKNCPNNRQGHLSLLEPLLLCALAQNSQHLPATTAVNLLRSLGRSSSWILSSCLVSSCFSVWQKWNSHEFSNFTTEQTEHHMYMMIGWKWWKSHLPQQKIWCCRCCCDLVLPWSLTIAISGQSIGALTRYHPSLVDPWVVPLRLSFRLPANIYLKILVLFNHKINDGRPKDVPPLQRCCSSCVEALGH